MRKLLFLLSVFLAIPVICSSATSPYTTTQTTAEVEDSWFDSAAPTTNQGSDDQLRIRSPNPTTDRRVVINFATDLSTVVYDVIDDAELFLYVESDFLGGDSVEVYILDEEYIESQVTWLNRNTSDLWTTAGGEYSTKIGSFKATDITNNTWSSIKITSTVQGWIDGSIPQYGLIMVNNSSTAGAVNWRSSDETVDPQIPYLVITSHSSAVSGVLGFMSPKNMGKEAGIFIGNE